MSQEWQRWLKRLGPTQIRGRQRSARGLRSKRIRLQLEPLEERLAPATGVTLGTPHLLSGSPPANAATPMGTTPAQLNRTVIANMGNNDPNLNTTSQSEYSFDANGHLLATVYIVPYASPITEAVQWDGDKAYIYDPKSGQRVYLDQSNLPADKPQEVSGAFLTDPSQITQVNGSPIFFTNVEQKQSPTCSFAAALTAVAESNFDLMSNLTLVRKLPGDNNFLFGIRLYQPDSSGVYQPVWINVPFDGTIFPTDLQSTDPNQYWPTLFQRAYQMIAPASDGTSFDIGHAFQTLTGHAYRTFSVRGASTDVASAIAAYLNNGQPMVAATRSNGNVTVDSLGVIHDDGPISLDASGVIHDHAYTVLGIDAGSTGPFVALRNPWAQDTAWTQYDTNHDGALSLSEDAARRAGLDGNDDGIIRIPWATFTSDFTNCVVASITGPSINQPLSPVKPTFVQPSISPQTVNVGSTLGPLDLSALSPDGKAISYYLPVGDPVFPNPGNVDLHTGQYTWTPTEAQIGVYNVTVVAQETPLQTATLTFQVTVLPAKPTLGSFTSDRSAISTTDGQIKLTAGQITGSTPTGSVLLFRDTNHNGKFENTDAELASLPYNSNSSGTYAISLSSLPSLMPGINETFFAIAENDSGTDSDPVALTVQVIAGASLPPLVAPIGSETLASSPTSGSQGFAVVAYDGKGKSAVFWSDAKTAQVYMLRLDSSGTAIGSPISLNLVQGSPEDVAMLPDGHFVIVWLNLSNQVYAMEFNADGTPYTGDVFPNFKVDDAPDGRVRVAIGSPGEFAVVVPHADSTGVHGYLHYYSLGFEGATQLLDGGQTIQDLTVAMDDHGAAVVGWIEAQSQQVMAQHFDQYGTPFGNAVIVNTNPNSAVTGSGISVAADQQGRYVFTWLEQNGKANNIVARRFLPDGTPVDAAEFLVNDSTTGPLMAPRVAFHESSFVITWATNGPSTLNVFAQAYTWDNTLRKLGGNFQVPASSTSNNIFPSVAIDPSGTNFIIAWQSLSSSSTFADTYFKRFNGLDLVPQGFNLNALVSQPTSLSTIPANPTAKVPLGFFTDPNPGNWTFTLVSGPGSTDNASFQIINGLLSMTQVGVTNGRKSHYSIRVRATANVGVPIEQVFDFSAALAGNINFGKLVPTQDYVHAAVMQSNGQYVLAGTYGAGIAETALARYNPDGSLDPAFGGTGQVVTHVLDGFNYAFGVAMQPNGQIVVMGTGYDPIAQNNPIFLARYNPDGSLDSSLGKGGILEVSSGSQVMAVQDDGKIVTAGAVVSGNVKSVALARYRPDGKLDPNFGTNGVSTLDIGYFVTINSIAIQPDGKIVVAGASIAAKGDKKVPFVARCLADGSPDLSFNGVGHTSIHALPGDLAYALAFQPDGKILIAGSFGLLRLTSSGNLDTTFNGTGIVTTSAGSTTVVPLAGVAVASDGKILAAGSASNGKNSDFVFIRYTSTGALDLLQTKDLGGDDYVNGLAISPSGQINIAGDTTINNGAASDFGLWQINVPVVTAVTPTQGLIGAGTVVKITGYNFTDVTGVAFGSTPAAFSVVSQTEITATSPTGTGTVNVTVTAANGTSITSPIDLFTYQAQTTLSTPIAFPNSVHPGDTLTFSVGVTTGSNNAAVNQGSVTFSLINPATGAIVVSDAGVAVKNGTAADPSFAVPAGTAIGTYNLVARYSDNGGDFASTSITANKAVSVTPVPSPQSPPPPMPPPPPPAPPAPPALNVPPLLALFNSLLGGVEKVNANGTETITDSIFGFPLLVATFDHTGKLTSVDLFGIDVTFLFG